MDCNKTAVLANTKAHGVDAKDALNREQAAQQPDNAKEHSNSTQAASGAATKQKSGFFARSKGKKTNPMETKTKRKSAAGSAGASEATDAMSNEEKPVKTSKQANETAKREGAAGACDMPHNKPLNFARNREYLQKQILELESKIEAQSMGGRSGAAPPQIPDQRLSIATSDLSHDSQPFNRNSQVKNRSRNHPLNGKNNKGRKTMPEANLKGAQGANTSRVAQPIFDVDGSNSQANILASGISLDNSAYLGGSAQQAESEQNENAPNNANINAHLQFLEEQDQKKGGLDNSFEAPLRKPQTCIQ